MLGVCGKFGRTKIFFTKCIFRAITVNVNFKCQLNMLNAVILTHLLILALLLFHIFILSVFILFCFVAFYFICEISPLSYFGVIVIKFENLCICHKVNRVSMVMENLEISGNFKIVFSRTRNVMEMKKSWQRLFVKNILSAIR